MKTVYYKNGRANKSRILRPEDLTRLGVDNPKGATLVFNAGNQFGIVMSNKASDSLVAALPGEFKAVEGADGDDDVEVLDQQTTLDASGAGGSVGNSTDSVSASGSSAKSTSKTTAP